MKKTFALILTALLALSLFAGGSSDSKSSSGEVYYLNFKPEVAEVYTNDVAPAFEAATGIKLKVVTAASNQYEATLRSEISKSAPPVIFQVNGPVGLANWKSYAAELDDTEFYKMLSDSTLALKDGGHVYGVPYTVEGYGIIYNDAIMRAYFALPDKAVDISSADEIRNFATLKAVVEDMTAKKDQLGIKGVFASTSMSPGNDWRWQTHLFNMPLWAEFLDKTGDTSQTTAAAYAAKNIDFSYAENFKNIWDLYLDNSTTSRGLLGSKSVDDSMAEFALGQAAMVQNGNWGASQILGVQGNIVASEDIKFLPIYTGIDGEESFGLCIGTENYLCINKNAPEDAQKNAQTFLAWLYGSDEGKKIVTEKLGFIAPFSTFGADEGPSDPLAKDVMKWMADGSVSSIPWAFAGIPSEQWKADFGSALLEYINGRTSWSNVEKTAIDSWTTEASYAGR